VRTPLVSAASARQTPYKNQRHVTAPSALLSFDHVSMEFPGVKALDDVSFDVRAGSIHALMGENGAGKSTLLKILSGAYTPSGGALVIGAECLSRIVDWKDRTTCVLFADGAGAVILKASEEPGILTTLLSANGQYKDLLYFPYGPSSGLDKMRSGEGGITMKGNEVFKVAVNTLSRLVDQTLAKGGVDKSQIDWLVPHQANLRIINAAAKKLDMPLERVVITVQDHGNTSAASIPLALDTAVRDGRIQRGQMLLLETFGGGFTWGSALLRF